MNAGILRVLGDRRWAIALGLLLLATALARAPPYIEPLWYGDEGIFAAVAHGVLTGGRLYADAWDSKPPLIFLVYALTLKTFGPEMWPLRVLTTATVVGVEVVLFLIGRRLYGPIRAIVAAALFGLLTSVPVWEGNLALTEIFMTLPMCAAVLLYLKRGDDRSRNDLVTYGGIGLLVAVAALFRQTGGSLLLTFIAWLLALHGFQVRRLLVLCLGFALPWAAVSLYFLVQGTFDAYWYGIVGFFFTYIPTGYRLSGSERFFIILPSLTVLVWLAVRRQRIVESGLLPFLLLWFTTSLAGALIAGRPYGHYLIQAFPPLVLLIAGLRLPARREVVTAAVAALVAAQTLFLMFGVYRGVYHIYRANSSLYYYNFIDYVRGDKSERRYNDFFDWHVNRMLLMASTLDSLGARGRTAFIWGEYPWLYPVAGLTPVTRFPTSAYAQDTPAHWPEFTAALVEGQPEFVIVTGDSKIPFPFLESFLAEHYRMVGWVQGSRIYEVNEGAFGEDGKSSDLVGRRKRNPPIVVDPGMSGPIP
jgi:4-amino-4-deoxy-L-arabinose transferase-like glycosyltransferase